MQTRKRAAIEFSLRWDSAYAAHNDRYFIENVDFWRDVFPGSLGDVLAQAGNGQTHAESFPAGTLVPAYSDKNQVVFKKSLAAPGPQNDGRSLEPGRYYPKGYFWKPLHSYPVDRTPVRLVKVGTTSMAVDTNHPLARYPLTVEALVRDTFTIAAQRGGSLHDIAEQITADGPGMQAAGVDIGRIRTGGPPLPRDDRTEDRRYHQTPRLVHHLDATARRHVRSLYGRIFQPRTRILDVMSSWESHLPESLASCRVEGLGLNARELEANPRLAGYLIHDLNDDSRLPYADASFDAVICTASIEYARRPWQLFAEIARIVRAGGIVAITISERWFPGRQVKPWAELHPFERHGLVLGDLLATGSFSSIQSESIRGYPRPPDDRYADRMSFSDPLYFIWAVRS